MFHVDFLVERTHILSQLKRHEEALKIFVLQLKDLKLAEAYCQKHYRRNDSKSDYLFSYLYQLQLEQGLFDLTESLKYLNSNGYKMNAEHVS